MTTIPVLHWQRAPHTHDLIADLGNGQRLRIFPTGRTLPAGFELWLNAEYLGWFITESAAQEYAQTWIGDDSND